MKRNLFGVDLALLQGAADGYQRIDAHGHQMVSRSLAAEDGYAYLIADVGASHWPPAPACCLTATELMLVLTADSTALNSAFEWLIRLKKCGLQKPVNLILNQVRKPALAQAAFARFRDLAQKKLSIKINLWGSISYDSLAMQPRVMERPLSESLPQSRLIREIQTIGDRLLAEQPPENQTLTLDTFWIRFLERLAEIPRFAPDPMPAQPAKAPEPVPGDIVPEIREEPPDTGTAVPEAPPQAAAAPDARTPVIDQALLARLCTNVEAISRELAALRHELAKPEPPAQEAKPEPVKLDFERFLSSKH